MNIVIISPVSIPTGMASTQRILLLSSIISQNHNVKIFVTRVPPQGLEIHNIGHKGTHNNISFEYLTGTNKRSNFFFIRRIIEIWGSLNTIIRILYLKATYQIDCIYLYGIQHDFIFFDFIIIALANLIDIPVAKEVCERTWKEKEKKNYFEYLVSPLWGISGAICISKYLMEWSEQEKLKLNLNTHLVLVPILVDKKEFFELDDRDLGIEEKYVLFSGAPDYSKSIKFIIDAMNFVWNQYPEEKLYITGFDIKNNRAQWLRNLLVDRPYLCDRIKICGFLDRIDLLKTMKSSDALLLPLFDDKDSQARFPNKIGEYLLSGSPVITCQVGEVGKYARDGYNAFVAPEITPLSFAKKILEAKESKNRSRQIGIKGKELAESQFNVESHSKKINAFFLQLIDEK